MTSNSAPIQRASELSFTMTFMPMTEEMAVIGRVIAAMSA